MASIGIDWAGGWRFDAYDSEGMPVDVDGRQELGAKPSDLLPMALAACTGTDVVLLLDEEDDVTLEALSVDASFTQDPDPPWAFRRITLRFTLRGTGLSDDVVSEAIRRSEEELCSVRASLGDVEVRTEYEIDS